jgi:uncharacterized peroxidase-related enzyme
VPHIPLREDLPGIAGLLAYKPATGSRLAEFVHELLRGDGPLAPAERETIAAYVSRLNECEFCARSHGATIAHLDHGADLREAARLGPDAPGLRTELRALLRLAAAVATSGHGTAAGIEAAREAGATDEEIHDTVLIASAFCMLNRYVDGLDAITPTDEALYEKMGVRLATDGYRRTLP